MLNTGNETLVIAVTHPPQDAGPIIRAGLGRCQICSCVSFQGSGNVCEGCGHHYDDHTTSPL